MPTHLDQKLEKQQLRNKHWRVKSEPVTKKPHPRCLQAGSESLQGWGMLSNPSEALRERREAVESPRRKLWRWFLQLRVCKKFYSQDMSHLELRGTKSSESRVCSVPYLQGLQCACEIGDPFLILLSLCDDLELFFCLQITCSSGLVPLFSSSLKDNSGKSGSLH